MKLKEKKKVHLKLKVLIKPVATCLQGSFLSLCEASYLMYGNTIHKNHILCVTDC